MTDPLDLAAVKARSAACKVSHECAHQGYGCERCEAEAVTSAADVPALVAEVERLREADRKWFDDCVGLQRVIGGQRDEVERLAAEVERRERIIDAERNMQAKLVAEGARLAAENARLRAEVDSLRSDLSAARAALDGYQSPEAAHALALRVIEQSQRAFRAEAALDGEREALSTAQRALANISGCGGCENCGDIASAAFASIDARRAAEAQPKETPHA